MDKGEALQQFLGVVSHGRGTSRGGEGIILLYPGEFSLVGMIRRQRCGSCFPFDVGQTLEDPEKSARESGKFSLRLVKSIQGR